MNNIVHKKITKYNKRVFILISLFIFVFLFFIVFFFHKIAFTLQTFKQLKSFIETSFLQVKEEMQFKDGVFELKLKRGEKLIDIYATSSENINSDIEFTELNPYQIADFYGKATRFNKAGIEEDSFTVSSKNANISMQNFVIIGDVNINYYSKINPRLDKSLIVAETITFFKNLDIEGKKLAIFNKGAKFNADGFYIYNNKDFGQFFGGVMIENEDYKITSKKLNAYMEEGEISNLLFSDSVVFTQKDEDNTIVYGDNAFYDNLKSEIKIYGNVKTTSNKNNLVATGESFNYNIITKKGNLVGSKDLKKKVQIELEI